MEKYRPTLSLGKLSHRMLQNHKDDRDSGYSPTAFLSHQAYWGSRADALYG